MLSDWPACCFVVIFRWASLHFYMCVACVCVGRNRDVRQQKPAEFTHQDVCALTSCHRKYCGHSLFVSSQSSSMHLSTFSLSGPAWQEKQAIEQSNSGTEADTREQRSRQTPRLPNQKHNTKTRGTDENETKQPVCLLLTTYRCQWQPERPTIPPGSPIPGQTCAWAHWRLRSRTPEQPPCKRVSAAHTRSEHAGRQTQADLHLGNVRVLLLLQRVQFGTQFVRV